VVHLKLPVLAQPPGQLIGRRDLRLVTQTHLETHAIAFGIISAQEPGGISGSSDLGDATADCWDRRSVQVSAMAWAYGSRGTARPGLTK
jgi:hypothetical protein